MVSCLARRAWRGVLAVLAAAPALALPARAGEPGCAEAAVVAEREAGIPAGLLLAIGRIESGRRDPGTGQVVPWPWTLNAAGEGRFHGAAADAVRDVLGTRARGIASIDVGCFQVNLLHHPGAFATLEEAFDPLANARYAARFLLQLRDRSGGWDGAVAAYHSATPGLGEPYRQRVMAAWAGSGALPAGLLLSAAFAPFGTASGSASAPAPTPASGTPIPAAAALPGPRMAARPASDPHVILIGGRAPARLPAVFGPPLTLR